MDEQAREQASVSALATEHFVLQAARSAIVSEQIGRAGIYMGAVSSALITLGFLWSDSMWWARQGLNL
jgi:ABC-type cobalamin transport system permease subunit